ncbi:MAG: hypothetical protein ABSD03_12390 [Vulcanimicrobiaceae bacterium]|jgi:hypothetical protein
MATGPRTYNCRFKCGHTETQMAHLRPHYKSNHKRAYEKWQEEKRATRADSAESGGGGESPEDRESELLFQLNAEFAAASEAGLDAAACGRVISYLAQRYAPTSLAGVA